jgi:hypothetical protein
VLVYLGSASGLESSPAWTVEGTQKTERFGDSVASAGDVNGDGYADVLVGAPLYDNGSKDQGRALVYLGSASGLASQPAWTVYGTPANELYGLRVATAGDIDANGYSDVIVGQKGDVYLGSASGLASSPAWTAEIGGTVAAAGDVNGDGYQDVMVGDASYSNDQQYEGRASVYLGPLDQVPVNLGGSVTGIAVEKVVCQNRTTGAKVSNKTGAGSWNCEALGLVVSPGDKVQTSARGIVTAAEATVVGSVTGMTPTSVSCENVTSGAKIQVPTSATTWDCETIGLVVAPGDTVSTGATGTAD